MILILTDKGKKKDRKFKYTRTNGFVFSPVLRGGSGEPYPRPYPMACSTDLVKDFMISMLKMTIIQKEEKGCKLFALTTLNHQTLNPNNTTVCCIVADVSQTMQNLGNQPHSLRLNLQLDKDGLSRHTQHLFFYHNYLYISVTALTFLLNVTIFAILARCSDIYRCIRYAN